jgi:hypothetical protein
MRAPRAQCCQLAARTEVLLASAICASAQHDQHCTTRCLGQCCRVGRCHGILLGRAGGARPQDGWRLHRRPARFADSFCALCNLRQSRPGNGSFGGPRCIEHASSRHAVDPVNAAKMSRIGVPCGATQRRSDADRQSSRSKGSYRLSGHIRGPRAAGRWRACDGRRGLDPLLSVIYVATAPSQEVDRC